MPNWTKEQLSAIDTEGTNILVSAGAGSGKTAVLSERVLRKVKDGTNIDRILILTFTKAASFEMMERIRKKLIDNKLDEQVSLIDKAYITTFDSFSLSIVNKYHDVLGLNNNIRIVDGISINLIKKDLLDEIFLRYYESKNELFSKLIKDFCLKDDKELKEYILKLNNSLDLKYDKKEYLNKYISNYYSDEYISKVKEEYLDLLKNNIKKIDEYLNELSIEIDTTDFYNVFNPLLKSDNYSDIVSNLNINMPKLPNGSSDLVKGIKEDIKKCLDELKELTLKDIDTIILEYRSTKDYIDIITSIILELDELVFDYKKKMNTFEFIDIAKLAIDLVMNNSDIREELTNSFDEIMIDEYQDTSDLQELFISLISKNNTYMVGDIKQSIYRFRNANPDIFKEKYLEYEKNNNGIKIDLNKNFRSRNEVLNNINRIFNRVMDLSYGGAEYEKSHQMIFGNTSYIEKGKTNEKYDLDIYNYEIDKDSEYKNFDKSEIEAFIIANDIKKKIDSKYKIYDKDNDIVRSVNYNDFVILVDRSTKFTKFKEIFEYLHIPLTIYKDIDISDSVEVSLIKNILKLIECVKENRIDDTFRYSYISIARSYLFRLSDNEIFSIINNDKYEDTIIYKYVKEICDKLDYFDLKDLIHEIKEEFDFDNKVITATDVEIRIAILEYFMNLAKDLSKLDYDYHMFIKYLDNLKNVSEGINIPISVGDNNSVRIMTIHKSKGLEYSICYYSMLGSPFNISELKEKILFDNKYGIITPSYINGYSDTFIKTLVKKKVLTEEISEKIRLFYVALTRCKEKMIVVASMDKDKNISKENYKSFLDILNSISGELDEYLVPISLDNMNITDDYKKKTKSSLDKYPKQELTVDEYKSNIELVDEERFSKTIKTLVTSDEISNMEFGTKIHEVFELTDFKNPNYNHLSEQESRYIKNFLNLDLLKNINDANILKEYEFYVNNQKGIIDLLLEYNNHIDIIDYKLNNIDDPLYIEQLMGYKKYISTKTNKNINLYLYSIINNEIKKIV